MKALVFAATLLALSSAAPAGAARDTRPEGVADTTTRIALADTGRVGATSLTALSPGAPWQPAGQQGGIGVDLEVPAPGIDGGSLMVGCGLLALLLSRPLSRALRRREQQRRATALASTLGHSSRG